MECLCISGYLRNISVNNREERNTFTEDTGKSKDSFFVNTLHKLAHCFLLRSVGDVFMFDGRQSAL